jgi:ABC-2 type transport system permease protein
VSVSGVLGAELRKTATLPAAAVAAAVTAVGCVGVSALNAVHVRDALAAGRSDLVGYTSPVDVVFSAAPIGTVGAIVLGVTAVSSEYAVTGAEAGGGRQIGTTLAATPRRPAVLAAKALVVALLVLAAAAVALPASAAVAHAVVGGPVAPDDLLARSLGAALYWLLTALMALAVAVLTRSGVVPLVVLIVNSSVVSVSVLLAKLTPVAFWLPDAAGMRLFTGRLFVAADRALDPVTGGLVMAAWTAVLLAVATAVFVRRDA